MMGPNYDLLKINKYMYKYKANILQNFETILFTKRIE